MAKSFENKYRAIKSLCNKVVFPIGMLCLIIVWLINPEYKADPGFWQQVANWWIGIEWEIAMWGIILCVIGILPSLFWFVPTGWVGFMKINGKVREESYEASSLPHLRIPILCDVAILPRRAQMYIYTDKTKVVNTINNTQVVSDITVKYAIWCRIKHEYAHWVFEFMGANYYEDYLRDLFDGVFDTVMSQITYSQIQSDKENLEKLATAVIHQAIDEKCGDMTSELVEPKEVPTSGGGTVVVNQKVTHRGYRCIYTVSPTITVNDDPKDNVPGICLFDMISVQVIDRVYDQQFEDIQSQILREQGNLEIAGLQAEQTKVKGLAAAKVKEADRKAAVEGLIEVMKKQGMSDEAIAAAIKFQNLDKLQTYIEGSSNTPNPGIVIPTPSSTSSSTSSSTPSA